MTLSTDLRLFSDVTPWPWWLGLVMSLRATIVNHCTLWSDPVLTPVFTIAVTFVVHYVSGCCCWVHVEVQHAFHWLSVCEVLWLHRFGFHRVFSSCCSASALTLVLKIFGLGLDFDSRSTGFVNIPTRLSVRSCQFW